MFKVAFTGERVTEESAEFGDAYERGWVDPDWSMYTLHENKEDVRVKEFDTLDEAEAYITDIIGVIDSTDGENYYAADASVDWTTGDTWLYCGHIEQD